MSDLKCPACDAVAASEIVAGGGYHWHYESCPIRAEGMGIWLPDDEYLKAHPDWVLTRQATQGECFAIAARLGRPLTTRFAVALSRVELAPDGTHRISISTEELTIEATEAAGPAVADTYDYISAFMGLPRVVQGALLSSALSAAELTTTDAILVEKLLTAIRAQGSTLSEPGAHFLNMCGGILTATIIESAGGSRPVEQ